MATHVHNQIQQQIQEPRQFQCWYNLKQCKAQSVKIAPAKGLLFFTHTSFVGKLKHFHVQAQVEIRFENKQYYNGSKSIQEPFRKKG